MKRKRYIRILMSEGYSRNDARRKAAVIQRYNQITAGHHRTPAAYQTIRDNPLWMVRQMFGGGESESVKKYLQVIAGCLSIAAGAAALYSYGGTPFDWQWWVVVLGFQVGQAIIIHRK